MISKYRLLSPQAAEVYKELLTINNQITAKALGERLNIFPNSIYRLIDELKNFGMVKILNGRPSRFQAFPVDVAVDKLFLQYQNWFFSNFPLKNEEHSVANDDLGVSFIRSRDESVERSTQDQKSMKKELLLIVSGDEVPSETILVNKRAMERGVKIKIIVQRYNGGNREMIANWHRMGMEVRFSSTIKTRITIIDSKIVYLVSYDPRDNKKGIGVRFDYQPVAWLLQEIFMQKWKEAKRI